MSPEPSLPESAVPFTDVVAVSAALAADPSRGGKVSLMAEFLARVPTPQVPAAVSMLTGTVPAPLGVGPARLRAAWLQSTAQPGLGLHDTTALTLLDVDRGLREIARAGGAGSVGRKVALLRALLGRASVDEQDFLLRLCFGELRQGALDGVMLEAIARAFYVDTESVRRAHMLSGDLAHTAFVAAGSGSGGLAEIGLRLFRPLEPMLAGAADRVEELLTRHGTTILEWKLDGARIQVHKAGDDVRVYTRSLRDVTAALPDVVATVGALRCESVVLDGEAIALHEDGRPYPFQITMSRFGASGPGDATEAGPGTALTPFFFDVLHLDGETLIDRPQRERMSILHAVVGEANLLPALETASAADAEAFMAAALAAGHEGVVAKDPEAPYAAGRRGKAWIKVKAARSGGATSIWVRGTRAAAS